MKKIFLFNIWIAIIATCIFLGNRLVPQTRLLNKKTLAVLHVDKTFVSFFVYLFVCLFGWFGVFCFWFFKLSPTLTFLLRDSYGIH